MKATPAPFPVKMPKKPFSGSPLEQSIAAQVYRAISTPIYCKFCGKRVDFAENDAEYDQKMWEQENRCCFICYSKNRRK